MKNNLKDIVKAKDPFKPVYCLECKQRKVCGKLNPEYCCPCWYQEQREKAEEYSDYQQFYQQREWKKKESIHQLQLLKNYQGCKQCGNLEVDAYSLYEENRIICQTCLTRKEGNSSNPISFCEQSKWYKRHWKIDLNDWLEKDCLPINSHCAKKWLKDKEHLKNCDCLEQESQEIYLLFSNSLERYQEQLKGCQCKKSEKTRISSDYYAWCEICEKTIEAASKKRVIKNRNDPKFWGLEIKEKILCLDCLKKYCEQMPNNKKYTFNKYRKRGYE